MLIHPTIDKLQSLRLLGIKTAYQKQLQQSDIDDLSFNERFGLLIDREMNDKENRRLITRLRKAKLK